MIATDYVRLTGPVAGRFLHPPRMNMGSGVGGSAPHGIVSGASEGVMLGGLGGPGGPGGPGDPLLFRINKLARGFNADEARLIESAYALSSRLYSGMVRLSGKPAIDHPVSVAEIIKYYFKLRDAKLITAALLHDLREDFPERVSFELLRDEFGEEIAGIVEGVTKLSIETAGETRGRESLRRMIEAGVSDVRVFILKWADNKNNMQDQEYFPEEEKRVEHAREALVYASTMHTCGVWEEAVGLERLAYRWIYREEYQENLPVYEDPEERIREAVGTYAGALSEVLHRGGIWARVSVEPRPFSRVLRTAVDSGLSLREILLLNPLYPHQVLIVVREENDIEVVERAMASDPLKLLAGKTASFLDRPKHKYRAIHHYCQVEGRGPLLVRVVDIEMNRVNRRGILYYIVKALETPNPVVDWGRPLLRYLRSAHIDSDEAMQDAVRRYASSTSAYTPLGREVSLVPGASGLDFAFTVDDRKATIHGREIGLRAAGILVRDGESYKRQGIFDAVPVQATVYVVTSDKAEADATWPAHLNTPYAMETVRQYLRGLPEEEQRRLGKEALDQYAGQYHVTWDEVMQVSFFGNFIREFRERHGIDQLRNPDDFVLLVGRGEIMHVTVGDAFYQYYATVVRDRMRTHKFRPLVVRLRIDKDQRGLVAKFTEDLARLGINIEEARFHRNQDRSATFTVLFSTLGSLQVCQIRRIINEFLAAVGGGRIVLEDLRHRNETVHLEEYIGGRRKKKQA